MLKLNQSKGGTKVPILGDLPLVGILFRSMERSDIQSKLYVFVRAEIIRPAEVLAGAQKELTLGEMLSVLYQHLQKLSVVQIATERFDCATTQPLRCSRSRQSAWSRAFWLHHLVSAADGSVEPNRKADQRDFQLSFPNSG